MRLINNAPFDNTGITTYTCLLTNNKPIHRKGMIDANFLFRKRRKNIDDKHCEFAPEHIEKIVQTHLDFKVESASLLNTKWRF